MTKFLFKKRQINSNSIPWKKLFPSILFIAFFFTAMNAQNCPVGQTENCSVASGTAPASGTITFRAGNGTTCNGDPQGRQTEVTYSINGECFSGNIRVETTFNVDAGDEYVIYSCFTGNGNGNANICEGPTFTCTTTECPEGETLNNDCECVSDCDPDLEGTTCRVENPDPCKTYAYDKDCNCVGTDKGIMPGTPCIPPVINKVNGQEGCNEYVYDENCDCVSKPKTCPEGETLNLMNCECEPKETPCTLIGQKCDDGLACTIDDTYDPNCNCVGTTIGYKGKSCDDGDDCTINDMLDDDCNCKGTPDIDSDGDGLLDCEDPCPLDLDAMVYADLKCGITEYNDNFRGKSKVDTYGACTSEECLATGRELIYRFNLKSQADLVIHFDEKTKSNEPKQLNMFVLTDGCRPNSCMLDAAITAPVAHAGNTDKVTIKNADAGVYYIVVDGNQPYAHNRFSLLIECTGGGAESCPDNAHYTESFESYKVGKPIASQDRAHWSIEGITNRSALVSNEEAADGLQSLAFSRHEGIQDMNLDLGRKFEDVYRISWDMYIEPMSAASFGLFGGDNSDPWGTIGHRFYMNATKYQGRWFRVELFVDMDKNKYAIFMDNRHFEERGDYYLNLYRLNFYNPPGGHFYIDNICYASVDEIPEESEDRSIEEDFSQIQLFPNPVREEMTLEIQDLSGQSGQLQIFNAFGQQVYQEKTAFDSDLKTINARNFENGIYWLVIKLENRKLLTKRFVMEHWR